MDHYQDPAAFPLPGYEVYFTRFADSIAKDHFKAAWDEIVALLNDFYIPEGMIIDGGGGLSDIVQDLATRLKSKHWTKKKIDSELHVEGKVRPFISHEVDHYRVFRMGSIGLEIEWNNKDTFFDRDLENFRKVHQIGEMAMGIIITRGASLQAELLHVYERFLEALDPFDITTLAGKIDFSNSARKKVEKHIQTMAKEKAIKAIAAGIFTSKFATSTTHMSKLLEKVERSVGDPCPLILIGIGKDRLLSPLSETNDIMH